MIKKGFVISFAFALVDFQPQPGRKCKGQCFLTLPFTFYDFEYLEHFYFVCKQPGQLSSAR